MTHAAVPRSLVWLTELDVLPRDRVVERRGDYLFVRSPSNPAHHWGNLLLFDREPRPGDGARWEALFDQAFGGVRGVHHRTFAWDRVDGEPGAALEEFAARGYDVEESIGLVAERLVPHPRESREVELRTLAPDADEELWGAVLELQVANRDEAHAEDDHRDFARTRLHDRRARFRAGDGAWYVALAPDTGAVVGSCGVVVTEGRGRFQAVDTALAYRRRGVASRLVVEAARRAVADHGAKQLVIVAETGYHALPLYESLGFERREHTVGVCRWQRA